MSKATQIKRSSQKRQQKRGERNKAKQNLKKIAAKV